MIKCEKCLYRKNCQFLATHKKTTVEGCTAFASESDLKAEAVKEFAERLNDYVFEAEANDDPQLKVRLLFADDIEKAKKEMVGES